MRRKKWDREDYFDNTLERAIDFCHGEFYDPTFSSKPYLMEGFFGVWLGLKDLKLRRAFGALLAFLNAYGWYAREGYVIEAHNQEHVVPEEGLLVFAAHRDLAMWMGEANVGNVSRAMKELSLEEVGLVRKVSEGRGSKGTLYLVPSSLISSSMPSIQHRRETQEVFCHVGIKSVSSSML